MLVGDKGAAVPSVIPRTTQEPVIVSEITWSRRENVAGWVIGPSGVARRKCNGRLVGTDVFIPESTLSSLKERVDIHVAKHDVVFAEHGRLAIATVNEHLVKLIHPAIGVVPATV